ncbi:uncharacterized protein ACBR49_013122 [Aulostomus maculatus]
MTHVHYKFSSKLSYDTVVFDGPHITLEDLKRQIMGRERLRAGDCDLQITNAQTKQEYTDDGLIPKGSSVIVRRIPVSGVRSGSNTKSHTNERADVQHHHSFGTVKAVRNQTESHHTSSSAVPQTTAVSISDETMKVSMDDQSSSRALSLFSKMANLADVEGSEEDKLKVMMNQSIYDPMNYKKFGAVLPANYTCFRCGNTGHHIRNCPTSGQDKNFEAPLRIKKSTGIPRSFMVEVDDPNIKGAMLTNCGRYAIPAIDAQAYAIGKKEKPPFVPQEQPKVECEEEPVPDELLCLICRSLLSDAVVIPCCGNSYCDDCIRTTLLDSEEHTCPSCSQSDVSPDTLIANKFLRQAVNNFKKERGNIKILRPGTSLSHNPTQTPSPVPTPPPFTIQSQPRQPRQSSSQQVNLLMMGFILEADANEAEVKMHEGSVAVPVSKEDPTAAPPQLITLANHDAMMPSVSVNPEQSSSAQQPLSSYPPGYSATTPVWTLPNPQGAPIPSLMQNEWLSNQRKKRSPHRGSTFRRSSHSRSNSKSSKSKSSRSYSRSSSRSRSRSRSRSQSRSRHRSPYSRPRGSHSRSYSSRSYSFGYKRSHSPTPSSSSSPQTSSHSRSKSQSDPQKKRHSSHHHLKKSSSNSYSSRQREEDPPPTGYSQRTTEDSGKSVGTYTYPHHADQTSSLELDTEHYLLWKRQYKEWCEKYFSSYVSHFHHLPPPLLPLPPHPLWGYREGGQSQSNLDKHNQPQGRRASPMDRQSRPSQSSSESRSPPSRSSSDCHSPSSQSSSGSSSSPSHSSSDTCSTPSEDGAHERRSVEKDSHPAATPRKISKEVERNNKQVNLTNVEHEHMREHEEGEVEESSSPEAAHSTGGAHSRSDEKRHDIGCKASDDNAANDSLESVQVPRKPDQTTNRNEKQSREERNSQRERGWRRGKESDCRQDEERHHKVKEVDTDGQTNPEGSTASDSKSEKRRKSKREDTVRKERETKLFAKSQSSKCLKAKLAEVPETFKNESPPQLPHREKKSEWKAGPLTERDIWEGGMKVKPQKKISINIKLEGKKEEDKTGKQDLSHPETTQKSEESVETSGVGKEEKINMEETEAQGKEKKESNSEQEGKADETQAREKWEQATFRDHDEEKNAGGDGEDMGEKKEEREEGHLSLCDLKGEQGKDMTWAKKREDEGIGVKAGEEEVQDNSSGGKEMEVSATQNGRAEGGRTGSPPVETMEGEKMREDSGMSPSSRSKKDHDRPNATVDGGSSVSTVDCCGGEQCQEKKTEVACTPEEHTLHEEEKLPPSADPVPHSTIEKEGCKEEEREDGKGQGFPVAPPPLSVRQSNKDTTTDSERKRQKSVELQRDQRGREREKDSVTPSSGKDRSNSSWCSSRERDRAREREGRLWLDRRVDRERTESKRSKERIREGERGREREHRYLSSSTRYSSSSHETARRDRRRGGDQGSSRSSSSLGWRQERRDDDWAERDPLTSESPGGLQGGSDSRKPRMSSSGQPAGSDQQSQWRSRNQHVATPTQPSPDMTSSSQREKDRRDSNRKRMSREEEWKRYKMMKGSKGETRQGGAERGGGLREDEAGKWGEGEVEEGERRSRNSSGPSVGQGNDRRRERTKQTEHKKEKRHADGELVEGERKKRQRREEGSRGEVGERWTEDEDHAKMFSVTLW